MTRKSLTKHDRNYSAIFAYRVPLGDHVKMLRIMRGLSKVYTKHGCLGVQLYLWRATEIYESLAGLHKLLGATSSDELWLEIDSYPSEESVGTVVRAVGEDPEAKLLWNKLQRITGPGRSVSMGDFPKLLHVC